MQEPAAGRARRGRNEGSGAAACILHPDDRIEEQEAMLTNIVEIGNDTYMDVLRFNVRTGGNLMAFGQAGIGKTEMAQQAAEAEGFGVYYLNLSVLEAPDMLGLPIITDDNSVDYARPKFLPVEGKVDKPVVLLVDEIDKSKPELQNPLLELFQSHTLNGTKLAIQAIIATGNLPDEGAHSQPVSHALTNRCKVYKLVSAFEPWRQWAQDSGLNAFVVGFLSKNQEFLSRPPVQGDPTAYCRPSPRAWAQAARELDQTTNKDSVDFQTLLVAGRVGTEAAAKFRVWLDHYRHLEPVINALVKDGTHPAMNTFDIDKQLVCAIGATNMVVQESRKDVKDKAKHMADVQNIATNVFGWLKILPTEFQIAAVKSTLNMDVITKFQLAKIPDVMKVFIDIRKVLKD